MDHRPGAEGVIWTALVVLVSVMAWEFSKLWKKIAELADDVHKLRNDVWGKKLKEKTAPQDVA